VPRQIRGYPTLKAFYNGREIDTHQARSRSAAPQRRSLTPHVWLPLTHARVLLWPSQGQRELPALKQFVLSSVKSAGK
jgi:hypothetical protein